MVAMAACADDSTPEDGTERPSDAGRATDARADASRTARHDAASDAKVEQQLPDCALRRGKYDISFQAQSNGTYCDSLASHLVSARNDDETGTFYLNTVDQHLATTRCQVWDAAVDDCTFELSCSYRSYPDAPNVSFVAEGTLTTTSDAATGTITGYDRPGSECRIEVRVTAHDEGDAASE